MASTLTARRRVRRSKRRSMNDLRIFRRPSERGARAPGEFRWCRLASRDGRGPIIWKLWMACRTSTYPSRHRAHGQDRIFYRMSSAMLTAVRSADYRQVNGGCPQASGVCREGWRRRKALDSNGRGSVEDRSDRCGLGDGRGRCDRMGNVHGRPGGRSSGKALLSQMEIEV